MKVYVVTEAWNGDIIGVTTTAGFLALAEANDFADRLADGKTVNDAIVEVHEIEVAE